VWPFNPRRWLTNDGYSFVGHAASAQKKSKGSHYFAMVVQETLANALRCPVLIAPELFESNSP
jgi:hypothetical protein